MLRAGGLWRITGLADAGRAGEAATEIATILSQMRSDPESYRSDFVLARHRLVSSILAMGSDSRSVADRLVELVRFDLPDSFYDQAAAKLGRITLASFHPFVAAELASNKQVFGAFGNDSAIEAAIMAAQRIATR